MTQKKTSVLQTIILVSLMFLLADCSGRNRDPLPSFGGDTGPSLPTSLALSGEPTLSDSPTLTWTAPTSGNTIHSYRLGVGTSPGVDDVINFTNIGNVTSYQFTGLTPNLSLATNYYFSLKAVDVNSQESSVVASDAWSVGLINDSDGLRLPSSLSSPNSCAEYLASPYYNSEGDGIYWVDVDGAGAMSAIKVQCDQTTDSGGWMLILNYVHAGGTDPARSVLSSSLPLLGSSTLGSDESAAAANWGHAGNALATSITFTDLRFYCETSNHSRIISFKTSHAPSVSYVQTGVGRMFGFVSSYTALGDHTANLPATTTNYGLNYGDDALIRVPFTNSGVSHWLIGYGSRWECDDYPANALMDTIHRVWVR